MGSPCNQSCKDETGHCLFLEKAKNKEIWNLCYSHGLGMCLGH